MKCSTQPCKRKHVAQQKNMTTTSRICDPGPWWRSRGQNDGVVTIPETVFQQSQLSNIRTTAYMRDAPAFSYDIGVAIAGTMPRRSQMTMLYTEILCNRCSGKSECRRCVKPRSYTLRRSTHNTTLRPGPEPCFSDGPACLLRLLRDLRHSKRNVL